MATVTELIASRLCATASIVIDGATWADYEAMLRIIGDRHVFVHYDHAVMELMVPSHFHERIGDCLRHMVDILTEEPDIPCEVGRSTTHRLRGSREGR